MKTIGDPRDELPPQPAPHVFENTIVSNSEGEIVVQRSSDFLPPMFVCLIPRRGEACELENGIYTVVNTATNQRFTLTVYGKPSDIGTLVGTRQDDGAIVMWMDDPDTQGTYTITRDGTTVSTGNDLSFFFDPNTEPSKTYTYRVSLQLPGRALLHGSIELEPNAKSVVVKGRSSSDDEHSAFVSPSTRYCLLYTSPSPRDKRQSRMPSSA